MIFTLIERIKEHLVCKREKESRELSTEIHVSQALNYYPQEMYNADAVEGTETFAKLSDELTTYIFSFLSMKELCTASYVNKTWRRLANVFQILCSPRTTLVSVLMSFILYIRITLCGALCQIQDGQKC